MIHPHMIRWFALALLVVLPQSVALAETIELVTYYPAPGGGGGDMNVTSLTVGPDYAGVVPGPGQAFITGPVGIGVGFTAADPPAAALEVVGNILATGPAGENALFISNRAGNAVLSGLQVQTAGAAQWTMGSRAGSEDFQIFSDAGAAARLTLEQGTGNMRVQGAADAASVVTFMPGADDAGTPAVPEIRVGIGANPPTTQLDVNGQIRMRGGAPNAAGGNANAAATQPLFTDANGVASRGWPAGSVIQTVCVDGGSAPGSTSAHPTYVAAGAAVIPITPRSNNSTLLVEVSFEAYIDLAFVNPSPEYNTTGYFRIYEVTGAATPRSGEYRLAALLRSYTARVFAPATIRVFLNNTATTARSFQLRYCRGSVISSTVDANDIVYTVTEIQN